MTCTIGTTAAAELLGVSVRTVHRMVAQGMLAPAGKLPGNTGAYLFDEGDVLDLARHLGRTTAAVEAWLAARTAPGKSTKERAA